MEQGKLVIFSAPSGAGKTTIVNRLLKDIPVLEFSISASSRQKRKGEIDGRDYYFFSVDEFQQKIKNNEFIEWEEVYDGNYYGTLKSEIERIWHKGKHVVFDVDVNGGLNIKNQFGNKALAIFVMPPKLKDLEFRLRSRSTETDRSIRQRMAKAEQEIGFSLKFDRILVNQDLETAVANAKNIVNTFLKKA